MTRGFTEEQLEVFVYIKLAMVALLILGGLVAVALYVDRTRCNARWSRSEYRVEWGPIQGCLVSKDNGANWFPADNLREVP